jgi:endonuclease YncB( thermonuclease family)
MKKLFIILLLLTTPAKADDFKNVEYLGNYDGDSITVNLPCDIPLFCDKAKIRVYSIDTAEKRTKDRCEKKVALEATEYVRKRLSNAKKIDLKGCIKGKYFRAVCSVWVDGKNLKYELLKRGYGYSYFGKTKKDIDWCDFKGTPTTPQYYNFMKK